MSEWECIGFRLDDKRRPLHPSRRIRINAMFRLPTYTRVLRVLTFTTELIRVQMQVLVYNTLDKRPVPVGRLPQQNFA